jgi:hypothetical protein
LNLEETTYWLADLLPGEFTTSRRRVSQSFPEFTVAELRLGDNGGEAGGEDDGAETVAATLDAARIEPQLVTEDGSDLRVEFITVDHRGHGRTAPRPGHGGGDDDRQADPIQLLPAARTAPA